MSLKEAQSVATRQSRFSYKLKYRKNTWSSCGIYVILEAKVFCTKENS